MPRKPRIILPNIPHHIVQRGHNRQAIFAEESDYESYLNTLAELKDELGVKVYSFCLMTNHVHLLLQPGEDTKALSKLMNYLSSWHTKMHNWMEGRTGTLWEGRFKSSPVDTDSYLMACSRYIELNPVRARMVEHPSQYRWSSYNDKIGKIRFKWLDRDPLYSSLGKSLQIAQERYSNFVLDEIDHDEITLIRDSLNRGSPTGNDRFVDQVESIVGRRLQKRALGRPRRKR